MLKRLEVDLQFLTPYSYMTELRHLQMVIMEIMKDIDAVCKNNNIEYYLLGGSAIGAIRHKGFIPWDDDLDIIMDHENYEKFFRICRQELSPEKYYIQEALKDWPMLFSKIRLKGTYLEEPGAYGTDKDQRGIFLDIFKLDNAPKSTMAKKWQYLCGKYVLCYALLKRGYKEASLKKKILMYSALPLNIKSLRNFFMHQLTKYNDKITGEYATFGERYRYKATFYRKDLFGKPLYVPFEDTMLPVPEKYDEMLTQLFGDYMTPPPVKEQQGWHMQKVDFGNY